MSKYAILYWNVTILAFIILFQIQKESIDQTNTHDTLTFAPSHGIDWDTLQMVLPNTQKISSLSLESNDPLAGFLLDRIEFKQPIIISLSSIPHEEVFVYPNPASDEIYIKGLLSDQLYRISIHSLDGKLLKDINS